MREGIIIIIMLMHWSSLCSNRINFLIVSSCRRSRSRRTKRKKLCPHPRAQRQSPTKHTHTFAPKQGPSIYTLHVDITNGLIGESSDLSCCRRCFFLYMFCFEGTDSSCDRLWQLVWYWISELVVTLMAQINGDIQVQHLTHGDGCCRFIALRSLGVFSWWWKKGREELMQIFLFLWCREFKICSYVFFFLLFSFL